MSIIESAASMSAGAEVLDLIVALVGGAFTLGSAAVYWLVGGRGDPWEHQ